MAIVVFPLLRLILFFRAGQDRCRPPVQPTVSSQL